MTDKLTQDIQAIVDSIFKQKEEAAMRKETEEALNKSAEKINDLTSSLEAKDEELSEFATKVEELEATISELSGSKEDLEKNLEKAQSDLEAKEEELTKRAEAAEEELLNMKKDQLAQTRYAELEEGGVAATEEKAKKDQIAKIREMEDEEFAAYKDERIELRKSILEELESSTPAGSEEKAKETPAEEKEETSSEEDASEEDFEVEGEEEEAAADSEDSIDPMKAVAAALNMEGTPSKDMVSKYRELGKAMASRYAKKDSK